MRATLAAAGVLGALAALSACSPASLVSGDGHRDGGLPDHALPADGAELACGDADCSRSELCVLPPCSCIVFGDGGVVCPPPYCATPLPEQPISCQALDLDGGITGTFTSAVDAGSRRCYQVCI
ncbi:MAG TPA: hypothetical protein VKZ18_11995 [Polyangia bacterium]|nr:hypothetical protein [Polyangia bacterium]